MRLDLKLVCLLVFGSVAAAKAAPAADKSPHLIRVKRQAEQDSEKALSQVKDDSGNPSMREYFEQWLATQDDQDIDRNPNVPLSWITKDDNAAPTESTTNEGTTQPTGKTNPSAAAKIVEATEDTTNAETTTEVPITSVAESGEAEEGNVAVELEAEDNDKDESSAGSKDLQNQDVDDTSRLIDDVVPNGVDGNIDDFYAFPYDSSESAKRKRRGLTAEDMAATPSRKKRDLRMSYYGNTNDADQGQSSEDTSLTPANLDELLQEYEVEKMIEDAELDTANAADDVLSQELERDRSLLEMVDDHLDEMDYEPIVYQGKPGIFISLSKKPQQKRDYPMSLLNGIRKRAEEMETRQQDFWADELEREKAEAAELERLYRLAEALGDEK